MAARQRQEGARAARGELLPGDVFLGKIGVDVDQHAVLAVLETRHPMPANRRVWDSAPSQASTQRACSSVPSSRVSTASSALWRRLVTAAGGMGLDGREILHPFQEGELDQPVSMM